MAELMEENFVQWVLSKDLDYLGKLVQLPIEKCLGTEVTTKHGRVDFLLRLNDNSLLILELETGINSTSKLEHSITQVRRYLKLSSVFRTQKVEVALLFAADSTPQRFQDRLSTFSSEAGIILRSYSIHKILQHYNKMVNRLNCSSGVSLGRALALGITSITWLNKFVLPFLIRDDKAELKEVKELINALWNDKNVQIESYSNLSATGLIDRISWNDLKQLFTSSTNFYVLKRLVEDFELIEIKTRNSGREVVLTEYGRRFAEELLTQLQVQNAMEGEVNTLAKNRDLTSGQKRLLLEILLNGNFTKLKVNIFYFLRFVHLTEGSRLPKQSLRLSTSERQYLNDLFKSSYNARTLKELILQTCRFCEELGLVERLPKNDQVYDQVMFTSLGARVHNYFEQLLTVERERHQIPMQVKSDD